MFEKLQCEALDIDAVPLSQARQFELLGQVPSWHRVLIREVPQLQKDYQFGDYQQALQFVNQIAAMAQEQDHYPHIFFDRCHITLSWHTGELAGLHLNDFICAAKCDQILE